MNLAIMDEFPEIHAYGDGLLIALGILSLRAGALEDYWAFVIEVLTGMDHMQCRNLAFVSRNNSAKLDMIQALVGPSPFLSDARKDYASKLIAEGRGLATRRNELVHGQFMISTTGGETPTSERVLTQWAPRKTPPNQSRPVSEDEVQSLAGEFEGFRLKLWHFYTAIKFPKRLGAPSHGVPD